MNLDGIKQEHKEGALIGYMQAMQDIMDMILETSPKTIGEISKFANDRNREARDMFYKECEK